MDPYLQEENEWEDANKKDVKLYNKCEERVCAKKEKSISIVKKRKKREVWVHWRIIEERVYQTLKVASNSASVLYGKEEW